MTRTKEARSTSSEKELIYTLLFLQFERTKVPVNPHDSPFWTIPKRIIGSGPRKGQKSLDKSIFSSDYEAVTRLLKDTRERAGITQVELAEMLEKSQSFVSKVERGERLLDIIQLRTICQTLGTTLPAFVSKLEKRLQKN